MNRYAGGVVLVARGGRMNHSASHVEFRRTGGAVSYEVHA